MEEGGCRSQIGETAGGKCGSYPLSTHRIMFWPPEWQFETDLHQLSRMKKADALRDEDISLLILKRVERRPTSRRESFVDRKKWRVCKRKTNIGSQLPSISANDIPTPILNIQLPHPGI